MSGNAWLVCPTSLSTCRWTTVTLMMCPPFAHPSWPGACPAAPARCAPKARCVLLCMCLCLRLCLCLCLCLSLCLRLCVCVCLCVHTLSYIHTYIYIYIHVILILTCISMCVGVCVCVRARARVGRARPFGVEVPAVRTSRVYHRQQRCASPLPALPQGWYL